MGPGGRSGGAACACTNRAAAQHVAGALGAPNKGGLRAQTELVDGRHRFYVASRQATTLVTVAAAGAAAPPPKRPRLDAGPAAGSPEALLERDEGAPPQAGPAPPSPAGAADDQQMPFGLLHVRGLEPGANACALCPPKQAATHHDSTALSLQCPH